MSDLLLMITDYTHDRLFYNANFHERKKYGNLSSMFKGKTILFIGAHPDDIELGAGGTLAKLIDDGNEVICATLSHNIRTNGSEKLKDQNKRSLKYLGVKGGILIEDFNSRYFHESRQDITDYFWTLKKEYSPDVVITHTRDDLHRDHVVVSEESLRPFRDVTIINYEVNRSTTSEFHPNLFVEISEKDINRKIKALSHYDIYRDKNYMEGRAVHSQAVMRGVLLEKPFVEAFFVVKLVV